MLPLLHSLVGGGHWKLWSCGVLLSVSRNLSSNLVFANCSLVWKQILNPWLVFLSSFFCILPVHSLVEPIYWAGSFYDMPGKGSVKMKVKHLIARISRRWWMLSKHQGRWWSLWGQDSWFSGIFISWPIQNNVDLARPPVFVGLWLFSHHSLHKFVVHPNKWTINMDIDTHTKHH